MSGVTDRDAGAKGLVRALAQLGRLKVRVGVLDDGPKTGATAGGRATLVGVAALHEYGAPAAGIPQRSFIRATVDEKRSEIGAMQEALAAEVAAGSLAPRAALERLGAVVSGMVQTRIAAGIDPPNAPSTVARKGSSKPLVDTGQLRSAVTWKVVG